MRAVIVGLAVGLLSHAASAQVIFPINRAEILAGSKFNLKVEFAGVVDPAKIKVTVNGRDHAEALGRAATRVAREDDKDQSSIVLRDVTIEALSPTALDHDLFSPVS